RLIEQFELAAEEAKQVFDRQAAEIRARAEEEIDSIQQRAEEALRKQAAALVREVRPLVEGYLKTGKMSEALAIRERMRRMRVALLDPLPDPGYLHITDDDLGKTFYYEVTGRNPQTEDYYGGTVYGTDVYCGDSNLASACVHAGVLRPGETGV